jgi:hypothetical protein
MINLTPTKGITQAHTGINQHIGNVTFERFQKLSRLPSLGTVIINSSIKAPSWR